MTNGIDNGNHLCARELSRREFVHSSLAATAVTIMGSRMADAGQDNDGPGFIDAHSHVWTPDTEKYPLAGGQTAEDLKPRSFTPEELMAVARPHGVRRVVLIQHTSYHAFDNTYLIDVAGAQPELFSVVATLEPNREGITQEMDRLKTLHVRGLRIRAGDGGIERWSENPGMKLMWKHGAETGIAMCPLINPDYLPEVETLCRQFPETTVVIDHFARIGIDGEIRESDLDNLVKLARFPRVHVKLSAFYALGKKRPPHDELVPMIRRLYDAYGPQRLMWASDCPYQLTPPNTYGDSVALIRDRIDFVTEEDKQWLLRKTAERVFF